MYARLLTLLSDIGVDTSQATPQTTFRGLQMDSLSLVELAVNAAETTGDFGETPHPDMTLAQAAQQLAVAPAAHHA